MRSALGLGVALAIVACAPSPSAIPPAQIPIAPATPAPSAAASEPAPTGDVVVAREEPVRIVANADEIARFPAEEKLEGKRGSLVRDAEVVESPSNPRAKAFAHLAAGTPITAISRYGKHVLVVFEMTGRTLVGWIPENALAP